MKKTVLALALFALAACAPSSAPDTNHPGAVASYGGSYVGKSCDAGRAVYTAWSASSGDVAVFVIDKAPECAQPEG